MNQFCEVCATLAVVNCHNSGQSTSQIAKSAKRTPSTIRRWLKEGGFVLRNGKYVIPWA